MNIDVSTDLKHTSGMALESKLIFLKGILENTSDNLIVLDIHSEFDHRNDEK